MDSELKNAIHAVAKSMRDIDMRGVRGVVRAHVRDGAGLRRGRVDGARDGADAGGHGRAVRVPAPSAGPVDGSARVGVADARGGRLHDRVGQLGAGGRGHRADMSAKGLWLPVRFEKRSNRESKVVRIKGLRPWFERGKIIHWDCRHLQPSQRQSPCP